MTASKTRTRVAAIVFMAIIGGSFLIEPREEPKGTEVRQEIAMIQRTRPDLICVGSSYLAAAVSPQELSRLTGLRVYFLWRSGANSACYYLFIKNVIGAASHKPRFVLIYFQDNFLTVPTYGIDGNNRATKILPFSGPEEPLLEKLAYREKRGLLLYGLERLWPAFRLREEVRSNVQRQVEAFFLRFLSGPESRTPAKVLNHVFSNDALNPELFGERQLMEEDLSIQSRDSLKFSKWIDRSFLPPIIQIAREKGIRLILVRMKRRSQAMGETESESLLAYVNDLREYLAREQVTFIDFSHDPRIRIEHYGRGDHISSERLFTPMLAETIRPDL
jgi:hypothetical protein